MSDINELIVSFFGNGYVTYLDAEISDHISQRQRESRQTFIDILHHKGYTTSAITEELDRQCYASTLRYIPSEDAYVLVDIGKNLWTDILNRIHEQQSMIGGQFRTAPPGVTLDIYRTDFQSKTLKKVIKNSGLHQAPVMRWTKQFTKKEAFKLLGVLMEVIPPVTQHYKADCTTVLQKIQYVNKTKSKKTTWAWLVTHPVMVLQLTPAREKLLRTLFSLSKRPVDWKGNLVSPDDLKEKTGLSRKEIEASIQYFVEQGIIRRIDNGLTPTGQGYVLVRYAFRVQHSITFAVVRETQKNYRLEVSAPHFPGSNIRDILEKINSNIYSKGKTYSEYKTPVIFPEQKKSDVLNLLDTITGSGLL